MPTRRQWNRSENLSERVLSVLSLCAQTEEEWQARTEQLIQAARERERERERDAVRKAVERAREQWRQTLAEESRQSVEMAISSTRQQWQARQAPPLRSEGGVTSDLSRLAAEKEAVWREAAAEREATVRAALENARSQWRAKQAILVMFIMIGADVTGCRLR